MNHIDLGQTTSGIAALLDLEELLATRLLVQGNSGSGKSHLLRRILEQSAQLVQQVIIDPEGDFVSMAERFGHLVVDAVSHSESALEQLAGRVRQHRVSVVLTLENADIEGQMRGAAAFLNGLFDVERGYWYPLLVIVDEAQLFAPAAAGDVSEEARRLSLGAMTNLMCRGRKRGLAGIIATQRLAKLAKNVAAEASNFLMGRTFLDIDMMRAAELLGMERRQAESFRDLQRGQFVGLGPAIARRPLPIRIGAVETSSRNGSTKLMPLPEPPTGDVRDLLFQADAPAPQRYSAGRPAMTSTFDLLQQLQAVAARPLAPPPDLPSAVEALERPDMSTDPLPSEGPIEPSIIAVTAIETPDSVPSSTDVAGAPASFRTVIRALVGAVGATRSTASLHQDFLIRCREFRLNGRQLSMGQFKREIAMARAGIDDDAVNHPSWQAVVDCAEGLPEEMWGVFLLLAHCALMAAPCPSDEEIARALGSQSARRGRNALEYLEGQAVLSADVGLDGLRSVTIAVLGQRTAPGEVEIRQSGWGAL